MSAKNRHRRVCCVKVYPCGPNLHSRYFPYIRNCLKPAKDNGFCHQHQKFARRRMTATPPAPLSRSAFDQPL